MIDDRGFMPVCSPIVSEIFCISVRLSAGALFYLVFKNYNN